ncbi:MAG: peptidase [Sphingobacteriales bacterium]|nr:peptidase [Sphingobacteriales bacterium]
MGNLVELKKYLATNPATKVVDFQKDIDKLFYFDFTAKGKLPPADVIEDTDQFTHWINDQLSSNHCRYGVGGYNEHRVIYARSTLFDKGEEPRRLHIGIDIWGDAHCPIYCPLDATVHSFNNNDNFGDYGATIILKHELGDLTLHTLYGHLSLASLGSLKIGQIIPQGKCFADFGDIPENGHWPPHLHFQLIFDMQGYDGDFPGVCRFSEREKYLENCPDPQLILKNTFN